MNYMNKEKKVKRSFTHRQVDVLLRGHHSNKLRRDDAPLVHQLVE